MDTISQSALEQLARNPKVEKHYAVPEICAITGTRESFIRGEIRSGRLRAKNLGRAVRVSESDLGDYLASRPERVTKRKKTPPEAGAVFNANADEIGGASSIPCFNIKKLTAVAYGSKKAEIVIEIDNVGFFELDLFEPPDREPFVVPSSVRDRYSGTWRQTFRLDEVLIGHVLAGVLRQIEDEANR